MKALRFALSLVALLAAVPASAGKNILISDSLLANSDKWEVKRGGHWGGINKWRFADYAVVESKAGWTRSGTNTNLFGTKTESHSSSKFSFVLSSKTTDSAFVDAAHLIMARSQPGLKLGDVTVGGDDRVHESDVFTAFIVLNRDTTDTWALSIAKSDVANRDGDYTEGAGRHAAVLTLGERQIVITPVFSKKLDKKLSFGAAFKMQFSPPAMGYEFVEGGQSLCAVEYFSSGISGSHKNTIWMRKNTDPRMELVLAAALTSVLELECTALEKMAAEPAKP
jgi:hypothetical protein